MLLQELYSKLDIMRETEAHLSWGDLASLGLSADQPGAWHLEGAACHKVAVYILRCPPSSQICHLYSKLFLPGQQQGP